MDAIVRESMESGLEEVVTRLSHSTSALPDMAAAPGPTALTAGSGPAVVRGMPDGEATSFAASSSLLAGQAASTSMGASSMMHILERLRSHRGGGEEVQQQQAPDAAAECSCTGAAAGALAASAATPSSQPTAGRAGPSRATHGMQEEGEGSSSEVSSAAGEVYAQDVGSEGAGSSSSSPVRPAGRVNVWDGLLPPGAHAAEAADAGASAGPGHDRDIDHPGEEHGAAQRQLQLARFVRVSNEGSTVGSHIPMSPPSSHPSVAPITPPRFLSLANGEEGEEDLDCEDPAMSPSAAATPRAGTMLFKAMHVLRSTGKRTVHHHRGGSSDESDTEGPLPAAARQMGAPAQGQVMRPTCAHAPSTIAQAPSATALTTPAAGLPDMQGSRAGQQVQQPVLKSAMKMRDACESSTRGSGSSTPHKSTGTVNGTPKVRLVVPPGNRVAAAVAALYPNADVDSSVTAGTDGGVPGCASSSSAAVGASPQASDVTLRVGEITARVGEEATSAAMGARMVNLVSDPISLALLARQQARRQSGGGQQR